MRKVIYDIETNGLNPDRIWCVVVKDIDTNEVFTFLEDQRDDFHKFTEEVEQFIGHNIVDFDNHWVKELWDINIPLSKSLDTLLLSRLFNKCWEIRVKLPDGRMVSKVKQTRMKNQHGLASWGVTLKYPKGDFTDFSRYTPEMLEYCIQDVNLNHEVYLKLLEEGRGFSNDSIRLEHKLQDILSRQQRNGFKIDVSAAKELLEQCTTKCRELEEEMQRDFPPLPKLKKEYTPRLNKDGESYNMASMGPMKTQYGFSYHGEPYSSIEWLEFNLGSPSQVVKRLEGHWKPVEFTEKGQPRMSDKNLETILPSAPPSIKKIKLYRMYASRCNELKQWIGGAERHEDGRLRGRVTHIGSWSGRASHNDPNTANISRISYRDKAVLLGEEGSFGWECRSLWTVEEGQVLVGCDASGIQLRILAHYLNHPEYTQAVLTDIHQFNADILGCDRDTAKTFIYSWLLGAGVAKTAQILNCSIGEAVILRQRFVDMTPGLGEFLKMKSLYAQKGWFRGLDGRKVYLPSDHLALTAFLQNGEHVIMALANIYWDMWATKRGILYKQCGYVHDEWLTECEPGRAEELLNLQKHSFPIAGKYLKLNCPISGEGEVGKTWADVH